jgi:phosphoenolpyruvate carboxykinase (ATP)
MGIVGIPSDYGLHLHNLRNLRTIYWNLTPPALIEQAIRRNEGLLTQSGVLAVTTGKHTGRSPKDKFIVFHGDQEEQEEIWTGSVNQSISFETFDRIYQQIIDHLENRDVFVQDMLVSAEPKYQIPIRIITEKAWHNLSSWNLFRRPPLGELTSQQPVYTVIVCPECQVDPKIAGINSGTFILLDFKRHLILIGGTEYAGEIKKSIFTMMNYEMPHRQVLPMHCSANVGQRGDVTLFFGLSGTGKTTLSSDPDRRLIGDDEHGWSEDGIFNFEGGCYAKTIRLNPQFEPMIWGAAHRFGSVLENVVIDPVTRLEDFNNDSLTENARSAYPLEFIPNHVPEGFGGHPETIFFLTADAFGVLPPISRLTPEQAMYYFLSGYTSKLAGTEKDLGKEPQATFSACFGAPFLPLRPKVYSELLGEKIQRHRVQVWLINTGWMGGPYGIGERIPLNYTRNMVHAAMNHQFTDVPFKQEAWFGLWIPESCPLVPSKILSPASTWSDQSAYDQQARLLVQKFETNFKNFAHDVNPVVSIARPHPEIRQ